MSTLAIQTREWAGEFGREYTDRNALSFEQQEEWYNHNFGKTRTEMNARFLGGLDRTAGILEVGCNAGGQLMCLQRMGFVNLHGVELQSHAIELSQKMTRHINIVQGTALHIPFRDATFDLVFTSGVLIHIRPPDLAAVMAEIHRCSARYVWGMEYYAPEQREIPYRGRSNLLWKDDFARRYLELFSDMELVREERFKYLQNENVDSMFLLEKR